MEQFYHFYIALNNVENIDFVADAKQLEKADKTLEKILEQAKVNPPRQVLEQIFFKLSQMH